MIAALFLLAAANPTSVHVRVDGSGYLRFAKNAQLLYAADVNLTAQGGVIQTADGAVIIPRIHVPENCIRFGIGLDGRVTAVTPSGSTEVGRLVLTMLPDSAAQAGLFKSSLHGALADPGDGLAGVIRSSTSRKAAAAIRPQDVDEQQLKIVVRQLSEIDNESMTLGDIATFSGDKDRRSDAQIIDLGRTPMLGTSIRFSEGYIATKLKLAGFKAGDYTLIVPEGATVTRPFQIVSSATMVEAAVSKIKEQYDVTVDLKPDATIADLKVPKGDLTLSAELGSKTERSISVLILADVDGHRAGSRSITLVPSDDQVGVKVGDQVTIRLIEAGAVVEISGRVKSSGWVGQTVSVQSDTGSLHTAKVISGILVEVRL